MGRKRQSPDVKKAKGNPGKRPIADAPNSNDKSVKSISEIPNWLDTVGAVRRKKPDTGLARAKYMSELSKGVYKYTSKELLLMKLVKDIDQTALAIYCRSVAEYIAAIVELDRDGATYETVSPHSGMIRRLHPAMRIRKESLQTIKEYSEMLGITPMARWRLFQYMSEAGRGLLPNDIVNDDVGREVVGEANLFGSDNPIGMLSNNKSLLN